MSRLACTVLVIIFTNLCAADYWKIRNDFIRAEQSMSIGNKLNLSPKEEKVNGLLMAAKKQELDFGFLNPEYFPPAKHFFEARDDILRSEVFKIIKRMPKGGALHVHDLALSSVDFVLNNITYRDNLYGKVTGDSILLIFALKQPQGDWKPVSELRKNIDNFDMFLKSALTLVTDNPYEKYPDVNSVWRKFSDLFATLGPMLTYRPVFEDYFRNSLEEFYEDNVNYMEIRGILPPVYELNGTTYDSVQVMKLLKNIADQFMKDHPDFIGIKYIYAPHRFVSNATMDTYIEIYSELKKNFPDFLLGFDLVGQEDPGKPLDSFIKQLLEISDDTRFYFHAGETNWNGMSTDLNLVDAILLNATRIGHGYALVKHPLVLKQIKKRQIAIEVNPISNQVLNLVKDLRNHPANILIAQNYPVVISSDDPGLWDASGLSFDFYETFMGMANSDANLRLLKQLALNSIYYSSMTKTEKALARRKFDKKWDEFIAGFFQDDYFYVKRVRKNS